MSKKTIGYVLIVLGAVIAVVSLAADLLGIGNHPGLGWQQLLGTAVGVIIAIIGVWQAQSKPNQK
jgi:uncharacterized membrane protein YgaE (UPF0421/DUF939 family)